MAQSPMPLAELIKINDMNARDLGISDLLDDAPFLAAVFATVASNGTQHKYLKQITAPTVGFRAKNAGRDHSHSVDELVTQDLEVLDASFHVDQAIADEFKSGRAGFMAREARRHIRASFSMAEKQLIYGKDQGQATGFDGLADSPELNVTNAASGMVENAGASADASSVFLIRSIAAETDFLLVTGNGGRIDVAPEYQQMMTEGATTRVFNAYVQPILSHLAAQYGSIRSVGRICNLGASANTLTDDLISKAIARFPANKGPTHLVMSRRSLGQLQQSRTATNPTGAPAPFPTEAFGVPIIPTDSVSDDETVVAAAGP